MILFGYVENNIWNKRQISGLNLSNDQKIVVYNQYFGEL